jgi:hypothetical protein
MMYKYTILYKNGKTWSGKTVFYRDIPPVAGAIMVTTPLNVTGYQQRMVYAAHKGFRNELFWQGVHIWNAEKKQRKPNPNSKTKKQKKFDEDYAKWKEGSENSIIWTDTSVKAYKKHLWNCKQLITDVRECIKPYYEQWLKDRADGLVKDDGWIPWYGGGCPVAADTKVVVKFKCGDTCSKHCAGSWYWGGGKSYSHTIVAYKLLETEVDSVQPSLEEKSVHPRFKSAQDWYTQLQEEALSLQESNASFVVINSRITEEPTKTTYTFWLGAGGEVVDDEQ